MVLDVPILYPIETQKAKIVCNFVFLSAIGLSTFSIASALNIFTAKQTVFEDIRSPKLLSSWVKVLTEA